MGTEDPEEVLRRGLEAAVLAGRLTPISLGPHCAAAWLLDHLQLRKAAYPLDWLTASPEMVEHCLADDFETLLDPRHHRPIAKRRSEHQYYLERFGVERVFTHHRMPDELDHFRRAVERFRSAPAPAYVYIDADRHPPPALFERIRARLKGPLLAYTLVSPGREPPAALPPQLSVFPLQEDWLLQRFVSEAGHNGLASRLLRDLGALLDTAG